MALPHHPDRRRARRMRRALRVATTTIILALLAAAALRNTAAAAAPSTVATIPPSLRGLWLPATREGDAACRRHRASRPGSDASLEAIVGGIVLERDRLRTVSDYGEGDFLRVRRIETTRPGAWRIDAGVTIEGEEPDQARPAVVRIGLARGVLDWRYSIAGDTAHGRYRRCPVAP